MIVGGGDGGVLREVAKHHGVERIVMCEIDEGVVNAAKKYFSTCTAVAFEDPRVELVLIVFWFDLVIHGCSVVCERPSGSIRCDYCGFFRSCWYE